MTLSSEAQRPVSLYTLEAWLNGSVKNPSATELLAVLGCACNLIRAQAARIEELEGMIEEGK